MDRPGLRILNFDDSVVQQAELLSRVDATTLDLRSFGHTDRLWAKPQRFDELLRMLSPESRSMPTFLGSGDFHHVTGLLLRQFTQPISVIAFDHHPDWEVLPPRLGCGAWVSRAVEQSNISKIFLVGNASSDLEFPAILTGNRRAVREGRIVPLPYSAPKSRDRWPSKEIPWRELKHDPLKVFEQALQELPTPEVYVTIDKDCLTKEYALTNWEEGSMTLELLLAMLQLLKNRCTIVGWDVTGEYSEPKIEGRWKAWCSNFDHPKCPSAQGLTVEQIHTTNARTNLRILEALTG